MKALWLSLGFLFVATSAGAHPVSFSDSTGIMGHHSPMLSHNQLNYSFKHWFALGVHHFRRPEIKNRTANFATANFLLKRWNGKRLQANIYAVVGAGQSELNSAADGAGLAQAQFDIEDRDYYFLARQTQLATNVQTELAQSLVRVGVSPYVESYSGLHSWLILEWQNSKFGDGGQIADLTPYVRIFYKNLLVEIGQSLDGVTKFNYIAHF